MSRVEGILSRIYILLQIHLKFYRRMQMLKVKLSTLPFTQCNADERVCVGCSLHKARVLIKGVKSLTNPFKRNYSNFQSNKQDICMSAE